MGHFKQALSDIQKANKADTANPETQVKRTWSAPSSCFVDSHQRFPTFRLKRMCWRPAQLQGQWHLPTSTLGPHSVLPTLRHCMLGCQ